MAMSQHPKDATDGMAEATLRFYSELNDYLPRDSRQRDIQFKLQPTLKQTGGLLPVTEVFE